MMMMRMKCPPGEEKTSQHPMVSPALDDLLELEAHQLSSGTGLDAGDDAGQALIAHLLQLAKEPRLEEDLGEKGGGTTRLVST